VCQPGRANPGGVNNSGWARTTTGCAGSTPGGTAATGPQTTGDAVIAEENETIDRKLKSICRGC
jgi:hypothetical protein